MMLPRGHRGDTIYPSRTLMPFHGSVTSHVYTGMLFSPALSHTHIRARAFLYACVTRTFAIFFGRRHVRANIAAYAYLYGIKNHPSLKMHRLLHSRGAESSQRDAEAAKLRDSRTRFTSLFHHRSPKCRFIHKEEQINLSARISPTILSSSQIVSNLTEERTEVKTNILKFYLAIVSCSNILQEARNNCESES